MTLDVAMSEIPVISTCWLEMAVCAIGMTMTCLTYMYLHRVVSTTIQCIACTGSWAQQPVSWVWRKWEILCLELDSNHISGIPGRCATKIPCRLPDVSTIPMPTCLCGSLPQRSVQTTKHLPQYFIYSSYINEVSDFFFNHTFLYTLLAFCITLQSSEDHLENQVTH